MVARRRGDGSDAGDEVTLTYTQVLSGGSLRAPEDGRHFSEDAARRLIQKYME